MSRFWKSRRAVWHLVVPFASVLSAPLHAQVLYNLTHEVYVTGGMQAIAGQTLDYEGIVETANGTSTFLSYQVSCGILAAGCTQGSAAPASASFPASPLTGMSGLLFGASDNSTGGKTAVSMSLTGTPTSALAAPISVGLTAGEFQQLNILYNGAAPPPGNAVFDITYNATTNFVDDTTGPTGHVSGSFASVTIEDPATFNPVLDANGYPSVQFLFSAQASQGNLEALGAPSALDQTNAVTVDLNHPYWVELFAQAEASLPVGSTDDVSVNLSASADPTFGIDPAWLDANPQYTASDFTIVQDYNGISVPEPATLWLLFAGIGSLVVAARRRRAA